MKRRVNAGVRAGILAAATTLGAMTGFGLREGGVTRPFAAVGRALLESAGVSSSTGFALATTLGLLVHVAWAIVLGVCFSVVAAPLRGARLFLGALAFGVLVWAASYYVLPAFLSLGSAQSLGAARHLALYFVFALALAVGMRLAPVRAQLDS